MVPTTAGITQRPEFGASFMEFMEMPEGKNFVGLKVAKPMQVAKQAGTFGKIKLAEFMKDVDLTRGSNGTYNESDMKFDTDSYVTRELGHVQRVDPREAAIYSDYGRSEAMAAARLRRALLAGIETMLVAELDNTSTFTGARTSSAAAGWGTQASADPAEDIIEAQQAIHDLTGQDADTAIMSYKKYLDLIQVDAILNRIKFYGGTDPNTRNMSQNTDILARALNLRQILISGSKKVVNKEGATLDLDPFWTDTRVMVCKVATSDDIQEPCVARSFWWNGDGGGVGQDVTMESWFDPDTRATKIRVRTEGQIKIMYADLGHLITGC